MRTILTAVHEAGEILYPSDLDGGVARWAWESHGAEPLWDDLLAVLVETGVLERGMLDDTEVNWFYRRIGEVLAVGGRVTP